MGFEEMTHEWNSAFIKKATASVEGATSMKMSGHQMPNQLIP